MKRRTLLLTVLVVVVAVAVVSAYLLMPKGDQGAGSNQTSSNRIAVMETSKGTMEFVLYEDKAPITTKNFITLANKGFYDNTIFHRVVHDFVIQGGDPTGTGMGGPGYTISDEFKTGLSHDAKGMLSMANTGQPHSSGSQFFVTLVPRPDIDGGYSVFGKLIKGENVLDAIGSVPTNPANDRPVQNVTLIKVTIRSP
ncbi:MAG: peptidylprolyl isomerase [Thaumarchaeota archaeon]|nr:peptidylprolyl isomerase [Nitrososphaerota archaeon]MCL5317794.1 peptidylprolyl isomerase [Nitrososphaerota archaeon]